MNTNGKPYLEKAGSLIWNREVTPYDLMRPIRSLTEDDLGAVSTELMWIPLMALVLCTGLLAPTPAVLAALAFHLLFYHRQTRYLLALTAIGIGALLLPTVAPGQLHSFGVPETVLLCAALMLLCGFRTRYHLQVEGVKSHSEELRKCYIEDFHHWCENGGQRPQSHDPLALLTEELSRRPLALAGVWGGWLAAGGIALRALFGQTDLVLTACCLLALGLYSQTCFEQVDRGSV